MRSFSRNVAWSLVPSVAALSCVVACSKDKPAETGGYQQGQVQPGPYPAGGATGQPVPAPSAGATYGAMGGAGPVTPTTPGAGAGGAPTTAPSASAGRAGSAQLIDPAAASVVQPIINDLAKQHTVAGSKPVGSPLVGNFQTGQTLEGQVQLQPQKCYTIVATALPPVTELNLQLVAVSVIPNVAPILAADSDTGTTAVIGKKPNCYKWPFPLPAPAKVVAQVTAGSGLAAIQVYEK